MRFNRINKITELVKLIWIFFERKVLNWGLLKHKLFRMIISTVILFFTISLAVIMYRFWTESDSSVMQTTVVLDVYSCTVMMWIFVCFLFIKILFMKTGTFMKFAMQFPVTKRETKIAILVFELSISLIVISLISMSVILSLIFKYGITFISRIICNIFFMSISFFLILELIYVLIEFVVDKLKITKMKSVIMFCVNTALLMMMYFIGYNKLLDSLLFNYIDKKGTSKIVFYAYLMDKYNFLIPFIAFFVFVCILSFIIVNIPTVGNELTNSYVNFGKSNKKINMLKSYFLNVARNIDSYNYTFITYFIFLFATILKLENSVYSIVILSINGIYIYIQTDSIRMLQIQKKYKVFWDYLNMIVSQMIYMFFVSIPMVVFSLCLFGNIKNCLLIYPTGLFSIIVFTFIGIIFPPKRENPFSVFIGICVVVVVSLSILLVCVFLNLGLFWSFVVIMAIMGVCVYYSILGLKYLKRSDRYERKKN